VSINTLDDVKNSHLVIAAYPTMFELMKTKLGFKNVIALPHNTTVNDMLLDVKAQKYDGFVYDLQILQYIASEECSLHAFHESLFVTYQPVFFRHYVDDNFITIVSKSIIDLQQTALYWNLFTTYITPPKKRSCDIPDIPEMLQIKDIGGIFLLVNGAAIGFVLLAGIVQGIKKHNCKNNMASGQGIVA
jgi:hypothetical protein